MLARKIVRIRGLMVAALTAATLSLSALPAAAHVLPLTGRQIAAGSPHVVVAVVEGAETRWNPQHTLIFTDYSLRIEDRLRGDAPARITLSIPGGTLDGKTHGTCVSTHLDTGARYLLFLQDLDRPVLVPVTGGWQGAFWELPGPKGRGIAARGQSAVPVRAADGELVEFSHLVRAVRELIDQVEASPEPADTAWMNTPEDPTLPAKRYNPNPKPAPATHFAPALKNVDLLPPPEIGPVEEAPLLKDARKAEPRFVVEHAAIPPLVFEPLPADSPFSPADQEMMGYWNLYLQDDLFRISAETTPDWGYGNGISEMAGFPSSQKMEEEFFGIGWSEGSVSATLYVFDQPNGRIIEADIAMSPGRNWTLVESEAIGAPWDADLLSFEAILLMDLATAWGFRGVDPPDGLTGELMQYSRDSVTNWFKGNDFRFVNLYAVDAGAARATYGGRPIRDGLVNSYSTPPSRFGTRYTYVETSTVSVRAGKSFRFIAPIKLENPGTERLNDPTVEVYLAPRRDSLEGAVFLKQVRVRGALPSGDFQEVALGKATVPRDTPSGTYYFAFVLRDPKDAYQANNVAWTHPWVHLTVTR